MLLLMQALVFFLGNTIFYWIPFEYYEAVLLIVNFYYLILILLPIYLLTLPFSKQIFIIILLLWFLLGIGYGLYNINSQFTNRIAKSFLNKKIIVIGKV